MNMLINVKNWFPIWNADDAEFQTQLNRFLSKISNHRRCLQQDYSRSIP